MGVVSELATDFRTFTSTVAGALSSHLHHPQGRRGEGRRRQGRRNGRGSTDGTNSSDDEVADDEDAVRQIKTKRHRIVQHRSSAQVQLAVHCCDLHSFASKTLSYRKTLPRMR